MRHFFTIVISLLHFALFAQDYPLTGHFQSLCEKDIYYKNISTLIRPATGVENEVFDSLIFTTIKYEEKSWLNRKIFREHLLVEEDDKFKVILDPILDFRLSHNGSKQGFLNTRGVRINGNLDSKLFFNTSFYENQAEFTNRINEYYNIFGVIPGYGRIKRIGTTGFDFYTAFGNMSLKVSDKINFTIGYDRLFIGDGYRSLLLSDFSAPMMYAKASFKFGRFEYNNLFTKAINPNFKNIMWLDNPTSINSEYPSKNISYNTLTYKRNNWHFSIIEALVMSADLEDWKEPLYTISPFFRTAYINYNNRLVNNFIGLNITRQKENKGVFYSQLIANIIDFSNLPEFAFQLGYKSFDFIGVNNLYFQVEYNFVGRQMYSHQNNELHYGHYNQPLAHPAGTGVNELLIISAYTYKRLSIVAKANLYEGLSDLNIFHTPPVSSMFISVPNYIFTGNSILYDIELIYWLNKSNKLQVFTSFSGAYFPIKNTSAYNIQIGLRTAIRSNYSDF
jgi:hypothetical protein